MATVSGSKPRICPAEYVAPDQHGFTTIARCSSLKPKRGYWCLMVRSHDVMQDNREPRRWCCAVPAVIVQCPVCDSLLAIEDHAIDANGVVTPAVSCWLCKLPMLLFLRDWVPILEDVAP